MTVKEAMFARRSMRDFLPKPVSRELLAEIFEAAVRTPSWANSQPWEVFVATGETLERIREGYRHAYEDKVTTATEMTRPDKWPESAKARQKGLHPGMVRDCGEDVKLFGALNQCIFNAPAVIYLCMDDMLEHWGLYDIGAYSQSIMLLAAEKGLGTIPAITTVLYPQILRKEMEIPENFKIVLGIAIGYTNEENGINNFHSSRSPLSETVRFFE